VRVTNEPKSTAANQPSATPGIQVSEPGAPLLCPTCQGVVDPRRTTQAISRNARLVLFCSSGCLRQFLAAERAEQQQKG
jgi:hypothetical protein